MQRLLGVAIGAIVGIGAAFGLEWLNLHYLAPRGIPAGGVPPHVVAAVELAAGALVGGVAAVRISGWPLSGWLIALCAAALGIVEIVLGGYAPWMQAAILAAPLVAGVVVSGIARPA